MREIRIELSPASKARMTADQEAACAACGRGCKGSQREDYCSGAVSLRSAIGTGLRLLTLSWPGVTALALLAFSYLSLY